MFMGGPMSVNDEKELPYLKEEKALIRDVGTTGSAGPWHLPRRPVHRLCIRCPGLPVHPGDRLARAYAGIHRGGDLFNIPGAVPRLPTPR